MKSIRFRCKGETTRELATLREAQGKLKDLTDRNAAKLRKEILEMGFTAPVNVWQDGDGICHILDGHQRVRVLNLLRGEGYEIGRVPVNLIEAANLREAKRLCLGMASQYGSVQSEGLYEFMAELELDDRIFENVRFPELPSGKFVAEFGDIVEPFGNTSTDRDGQGVASTWESCRKTGAAPVRIGPWESRLPIKLAEAVVADCTRHFEQTGKPMHERLAEVLTCGLQS